MPLVVSGANGRLGKALTEQLIAHGHRVRTIARTPARIVGADAAFGIGSYSPSADFAPALHGVDAVVHCASPVWLPPGERDAEAQFEAANVGAARRLAEQAAAAGVRRLIYISSLTVNGKKTVGTPFTPDDAPAPESIYSRSKARAEDALRDVAARTGLEVAVIRPPRIFWPELTGNLSQLGALVRRGVPLPFGAVRNNARDNVSSHNLLALIARCLDHPAAANQIFLASDDDPLSTRALIERLGVRVGRKPVLVPVGAGVLRRIIGMAPARLRGRLSAKELADELLCDLRIDSAKTRALLGWAPSPSALPAPDVVAASAEAGARQAA